MDEAQRCATDVLTDVVDAFSNLECAIALEDTLDRCLVMSDCSEAAHQQCCDDYSADYRDCPNVTLDTSARLNECV